MLNIIRHDTAAPTGADAPALILAHGLFGSAKNWGAVARALSASRPVLAVDMRNHGESFHDADMSYDAMADDLAEVIATLDGPVDIVGHSMGGKAVMRLTERGGEAAQRLRRVIIADIAPIAYEHSHLDLIEAMQALDLSQISRRSDADRALTERVPDRALRGFLLQSLDVSGKTWRLGLDHLAAMMPEIIGYPTDAGRFDGALTMLAGGNSPYVPDAAWPDVLRRFPQARLVRMAGLGHWLHAEDPERFIAEVEATLHG